VLGIILIDLPVPQNNVRVFVALVVLATNKEVYARCDIHEAIFLNNGLDLRLGGGDALVSFLIVPALKRDKKHYYSL